MSAPPTQVRLFGKLPAHGDFVSRGYTAAARDALDRWLAESMTAARATIGDAFEDRYDRAPPVQYALHEGGTIVAGALAPSVDSAGRRYPISLGLAGVDDTTAGAAAARCEDLIYAALGEGWDVERLYAEVLAWLARLPQDSVGPERSRGGLSGEAEAPLTLASAPLGTMSRLRSTPTELGEPVTLQGDSMLTDKATVVAPSWWSDGGEDFAPVDLSGSYPPGLIAAMLQPRKDDR